MSIFRETPVDDKNSEVSEVSDGKNREVELAMKHEAELEVDDDVAVDDDGMVNTITLRDILRTKSDFDGIGAFGKFVVYMVISAFIPALFMRGYGGETRSALNTFMASYPNGDDDYEYSTLENVHQASDYVMGLANYLVDTSGDIGYADEQVWASIAQVKYIQLGAYFERSDDFQSEDDSQYLLELYEAAQRDNDERWDISDSLNCGCWGEDLNSKEHPFCYFGVYQQPFNRTDASEKIKWWKQNLIDRVGGGLVHVEFMMFTENPEASGFTNGNLDWLYFDGRNPLETHPMMTSVPVWPNSVYAADLRNAIRTFFEIIFMTMVFSYNWEELKDFQLTKAAFRTMRPYFKSPWNWLDLISQFFCMLTMSGLYLVTIPIFDEAPAWPPTSPRDVWYGGGLNGGWYLNAICRSAGMVLLWYFNFLFLGGRLFQYFKFHPGLSVYIKIFERSFGVFQDFLVWFIYVGVWLTTFFWLFVVSNGGNPSFITFSEALNSMFLLTFGFMDYEGFYNDNIGPGYWSLLVIAIFWVLVLLMILYAQNIILAIVASAYDTEAEIATANQTHSFPHIVFSRCIFSLQWFYEKRKGWNLKAWYHQDDALSHLDHAANLSQDNLGLTSKWKLMSHPAIDMVYMYFIGPLKVDLSDRSLELPWLWDSGAAMEQSFDALRQTADQQQMGGAKKRLSNLWSQNSFTQLCLPPKAELLDVPMTEVQLLAVFESIIKSAEFKEVEVGIIRKQRLFINVEEVLTEPMRAKFVSVVFKTFQKPRRLKVLKTGAKFKTGGMFKKLRGVSHAVNTMSDEIGEAKSDIKDLKNMIANLQLDLNKLTATDQPAVASSCS